MAIYPDDPPLNTRRPGLKQASKVAPAQLVAPSEAARKSVVRLVLIVYLLAVLEGILRKWLLPQLSQYIYFIRDPFVLLAYLVAALNGLWPRHSVALRVGLAAAGLGGLVALLQLVQSGFGGTQAMLAIYGWRNYFYYMPLGFLIPSVIRPHEFKSFIRVTLMLSLPIAVLVVLQFRSPPGAAINVGLAVDGIAQFKGLGLDADHTRPMGPFTSPTGQSMFLDSAFSILIGLLLIPRRRRLSEWLLILPALLCLMTSIGLSGSRYTLLHCALPLAAAFLLGLLSRNRAVKWRAVILPSVGAVLVGFLYPLIFPQGFASISTRWNSAYALESQQYQGGVFGRATAAMTDFLPLLKDFPALGYGLGFGGNASTTLGATINGVSALEIAESDWSRHIVDFGPIFGSAVILLRILLVAWLARLILRHTRRVGEAMPLMLFAFVGIELLYGQVTGHGTVNVFAWIFLGLCLASMTRPHRLGIRLKQRQSRNRLWREPLLHPGSEISLPS